MTFLGIFRHAPDCRFIRPGNLPERFGKAKGQKATQMLLQALPAFRRYYNAVS